jgi:hypothetical protein
VEKFEKVDATKTTFKKSKFQWQPFLMDLGIEVAKGLLVGASMSVGRIAVDRAFAPKVSNKSLALIPGGNQKVG